MSRSHDTANFKAEPGFRFIECQNALTNMHIGKATMQAAGCEVIATYNVIKALSDSNRMWNGVGKLVGWASLSYLISAYERDGIVHSGKFGVAPGAIVDMLHKLGYNTDVYVPGRKKYDITAFTDKAKAIIMTFYNDGEDLMQEIHTVAVTKDENGFTAHNVYCNGYVHGPYKTMDELVGNIWYGKARPIIYIGII